MRALCYLLVFSLAAIILFATFRRTAAVLEDTFGFRMLSESDLRLYRFERERLRQIRPDGPERCRNRPDDVTAEEIMLRDVHATELAHPDWKVLVDKELSREP